MLGFRLSSRITLTGSFGRFPTMDFQVLPLSGDTYVYARKSSSRYPVKVT